ncbi:unnamed protein product [Sphenostylis stenocarpa]|uniref:Uncharacterized protein n=1 Tax=Sphenostylis stenocarpa TaxID=92480 RepID=A0AA86VXX2_9FABA|nr:unnamed protein product [Sphenostylis stenocarpa]
MVVDLSIVLCLWDNPTFTASNFELSAIDTTEKNHAKEKKVVWEIMGLVTLDLKRDLKLKMGFVNEEIKVVE